MSHVLAAREDPAGLINRGVAISAAASGLVLAGTAAASYELVPALFGEQWRAAGTIVPWICAALVVAGPVSVVGVGFLYALGEPGIVLRAILLHTIALYAVAFPLLPVVGPAAIGLGSLAGASWTRSSCPARSRSARPLARCASSSPAGRDRRILRRRRRRRVRRGRHGSALGHRRRRRRRHRLRRAVGRVPASASCRTPTASWPRRCAAACPARASSPRARAGRANPRPNAANRPR